MPDEDFTSIEAALQVVEKFASRLTVGDAEGHVRRSVDELCAAVTKKEGIEIPYRTWNLALSARVGSTVPLMLHRVTSIYTMSHE
jgi:hypothetical protein